MHSATNFFQGARARRELTREGVFARERPEGGWNLAPPRHAELLTEDVGMRFRRSRRDAEPVADLLVRAAAGDQLHDLQLPIGESERPLSCAPHGKRGYARAAEPTIGRWEYSRPVGG